MSINGPGPIQPENILAYQALHRVQFTSWELSVLEQFDAIALDAMHKQQSKT